MRVFGGVDSPAWLFRSVVLHPKMEAQNKLLLSSPFCAPPPLLYRYQASRSLNAWHFLVWEGSSVEVNCMYWLPAGDHIHHALWPRSNDFFYTKHRFAFVVNLFSVMMSPSIKLPTVFFALRRLGEMALLPHSPSAGNSV